MRVDARIARAYCLLKVGSKYFLIGSF